jgi:hypothetical protein
VQIYANDDLAHVVALPQALDRPDPVGDPRRSRSSTSFDKKIKVANQELTELVASTGSRLQKLHGIARQAPPA